MSQAEQKTINVDAQTIFTLKLQEFDKKITEAELEVARLKNAKCTFIYDSNVQVVLQKETTTVQT